MSYLHMRGILNAHEGRFIACINMADIIQDHLLEWRLHEDLRYIINTESSLETNNG